MKKNIVFLLVLVIMTGMACSTAEIFSKPTSTSVPSQTFTPRPTFTPSATGTPTIQPPGMPQGGYSNVYGRVLWRGEPVADFEMNLIGNDTTLIYKTDSEGRFIWERVKGGEYTLRGVIWDSELKGVAAVWVDHITVPDHENYNYGEYWLLEPDLVLLEPAFGSETDEIQPSFRWEAYSGAAYYMLQLESFYGEYSNMQTKVEGFEYTVQKPLLACFYRWDVIAYDETGRPLARSNASYLGGQTYNQYYDGGFDVNNDELGSCVINLISPADSAAITSSQVFKWETQPLVVRYNLNIEKIVCEGYIHGWGACDPSRMRTATQNFFSGDFIFQEDGTLTGPSLPSLQYFPAVAYYRWNITGYDQDGLRIAVSETRSFTIP